MLLSARSRCWRRGGRCWRAPTWRERHHLAQRLLNTFVERQVQRSRCPSRVLPAALLGPFFAFFFCATGGGFTASSRVPCQRLLREDARPAAPDAPDRPLLLRRLMKLTVLDTVALGLVFGFSGCRAPGCSRSSRRCSPGSVRRLDRGLPARRAVRRPTSRRTRRCVLAIMLFIFVRCWTTSCSCRRPSARASSCTRW